MRHAFVFVSLSALIFASASIGCGSSDDGATPGTSTAGGTGGSSGAGAAAGSSTTGGTGGTGGTTAGAGGTTAGAAGTAGGAAGSSAGAGGKAGGGGKAGSGGTTSAGGAGGSTTEPATCDEAHGDRGCCDGATVYFWDTQGDQLASDDCSAKGQVCGWLADKGYYDCADAADADPAGTFPLACGGAVIPEAMCAPTTPGECGSLATQSNADCDTCLMATNGCCSENKACSDSDACLALLDCEANCDAGDDVCAKQCEVDNAEGVDLLKAFNECFGAGACKDKCNPMLEPTCNPITNEGCKAGDACDTAQGGYQCYAPPNDKKLCEACGQADGFCEGGLTCIGTCAKFCCDDADCGTGKCEKSADGVGVCVKELGKGNAAESACDAPLASPSGGKCYPFPAGAGGAAGAAGSGGGGEAGAAGEAGAGGAAAGAGGEAGMAGAAGEAGMAGAAGAPAGISDVCLGCLGSKCNDEFTACAGDPACQSCALSNPSDPACAANAKFLAAVACGCAADKCAASECTAECKAPVPTPFAGRGRPGHRPGRSGREEAPCPSRGMGLLLFGARGGREPGYQNSSAMPVTHDEVPIRI
jgi:hypothetical protein